MYHREPLIKRRRIDARVDLRSDAAVQNLRNAVVILIFAVEIQIRRHILRHIGVMDIFPDNLLVHQKTELLIDRHQIGEILPSSRRYKLHAVHIRLHTVKVAGAKFQVA